VIQSTRIPWRARAIAWLLAWMITAPMFTAVAEQNYTVRRGDTLYGIARKHGITAARLAARNGLSKNYYVRIGQRLVIPEGPGEASPELPFFVQRAIDRAEVKAGRWKYIIIHHSGVDTGTVNGMDRYHREERHMENGLAYHFVIGNGHGMADGEIGVGSRWTRQLDGGHVTSASQNKVCLGICLVGNFDRHEPTPKQLAQLKVLVQALLRRCALSASAVKTHQQINVLFTRCPGQHFPTKRFLASLEPAEPRRTASKP
jgi:LysM repeat protein